MVKQIVTPTGVRVGRARWRIDGEFVRVKSRTKNEVKKSTAVLQLNTRYYTEDINDTELTSLSLSIVNLLSVLSLFDKAVTGRRERLLQFSLSKREHRHQSTRKWWYLCWLKRLKLPRGT